MFLFRPDEQPQHQLLTETITGLKTFTAAPITFSGVNVFTAVKDTGSTLPAGLFGIQSVNNTFRIIRNTAAAGDFSTLTVPLVFSATDTATFVSTVAGADATAATHFLTRGQVVSTTVKNDFISLGTVTFEFPPSGWTLTRLAAGNIQVTHNLGTTNYTVVSSGSTNSRVTSLGNKLTNSFSILTFISSTLVLTDDYFAFILTKN